MTDKGKPPERPGEMLSAYMRHNTRQRRAIVAYIEEVTGFALDEVPPDAQERLAFKWIQRYAAQFRSEEDEFNKP